VCVMSWYPWCVPLNLFSSANPRLINRYVTYHVDTGDSSPLRLTSAALSQVQQQQQQGRGVGTPVSESFYSGALPSVCVLCEYLFRITMCAVRRVKTARVLPCLTYLHTFTHVRAPIHAQARAPPALSRGTRRRWWWAASWGSE
jgi:hypothetical protein